LQQPVAKLTGMGTSMEKVPQPVAQLPEKSCFPILQRLVAQIPWGHNIFGMKTCLQSVLYVIESKASVSAKFTTGI
jgi:hypothetical protein